MVWQVFVCVCVLHVHIFQLHVIDMWCVAYLIVSPQSFHQNNITGHL